MSYTLYRDDNEKQLTGTFIASVCHIKRTMHSYLAPVLISNYCDMSHLMRCYGVIKAMIQACEVIVQRSIRGEQYRSVSSPDWPRGRAEQRGREGLSLKEGGVMTGTQGKGGVYSSGDSCQV